MVSIYFPVFHPSHLPVDWIVQLASSDWFDYNVSLKGGIRSVLLCSLPETRFLITKHSKAQKAVDDLDASLGCSLHIKTKNRVLNTELRKRVVFLQPIQAHLAVNFHFRVLL